MHGKEKWLKSMQPVMQTTFIQIFVIAIFNFKRKFKKVYAVRPPHSDFTKN